MNKTPQEITDYKQQWLPGHPVRLHSDLEDKGRTWCKRCLDKWEWHYKRHTNIYEHTFYFESIYAAQNFAMEMGRFANL